MLIGGTATFFFSDYLYRQVDSNFFIMKVGITIVYCCALQHVAHGPFNQVAMLYCAAADAVEVFFYQIMLDCWICYKAFFHCRSVYKPGALTVFALNVNRNLTQLLTFTGALAKQVIHVYLLTSDDGPDGILSKYVQNTFTTIVPVKLNVNVNQTNPRIAALVENPVIYPILNSFAN